MSRRELTDDQWQKLEPLLPPQQPRTGHPNKDHRLVLEGFLWVLRTGAPWREVPERFGPTGTLSSRCYRWRQAGSWDRILAALQEQADRDGDVAWTLHFVDGTVVRAHQHAAGASTGGLTTRRSGGAGAGAAPRCMSGRHGGASPSSSR